MAQFTIRPATKADLPDVYDVWYRNEIRSDANPPAPDLTDPAFVRERETGEMLVAEEAERGGRIVGFACTLTRGEITYLAELFVRPECHAAGVGQALLSRILPRGGQTLCTSASTDFRALALYTRAGMQPRWPNVWLMLRPRGARTPPEIGIEAVQADPADPDLDRWDRDFCGRERRQDRDFWLQTLDAVPLWLERAGERVGYGVVQMRSPGVLRRPEAPTLGPIGARRAEDSAGCVVAVARWALEQRPESDLRMFLPGPHPALPVLLDAGWRITYVETFCCSAEPFFDPTRYVYAGGWI